MFEIGWTEMLVIAIVMIVVVGPKDLPKMLRTVGKTVSKMRGMAGDFQKQFNEALKEAELDDVKKSIDEIRSLNPTAEIRKQLNPFEKAAADVRSGLDQAMKPKPSTSAAPASSEVHEAEPLKAGAINVPGPDAMPAPPEFAAPMPVAAVPFAASAHSTITAEKVPVGQKPKSAAKAKSGAAKASAARTGQAVKAKPNGVAASTPASAKAKVSGVIARKPAGPAK